MVAIHQKLAIVVVLLTLGGVIWSGSRASHGVVSSRLRGFAVLTTLVIALEAIAGIAAAASGARPDDATHFVYGPATLLALPLTLLIARRAPRGTPYIVLAGWLVTFVLSLRDLGTGGIGG